MDSEDYNSTDTPSYDIDSYLYPAIDHVILPVVWPTIIIIGLLGNAGTILVLLRVQQMKTPLNVYLVSLAFSDSVFLVVAPIPFLRSYAENDIHDSFHQGEFTIAACKIIVFLIDSSFQISNCMILCISAERYLAICKPFRYRESGTRSRAFKISLSVWIIVFLYQSRLLFSVSTLKLDFNWLDAYSDFPSQLTICHYCDSLDTENESLACKVVYNLYVADIGVGLVVIVSIIPLYVLMVLELRKSPFTESQNVENRIKSEKKIFKTVATTVIIYVACFLPYRLLNLFMAYYKSFDELVFIKVANLTRTPMFINAAINPIIYTVTNRTYREAFGWYFNPCGCKITIAGERVGLKKKDRIKSISPVVSSVTTASVVSNPC